MSKKDDATYGVEKIIRKSILILTLKREWKWEYKVQFLILLSTSMFSVNRTTN